VPRPLPRLKFLHNSAHHLRLPQAITVEISAGPARAARASAGFAGRGGVMTALDRPSIDRLIKLLGMLGSAHDGERAAAGLKAHQLVTRSGLQWSDVIALPLPAVEPHWRTMAMACCRHLDSLNSKERAFVQAMATWRGAWLRRFEDLS
jgi:hypothetical protein